jgi:hypothetical protein
MSAALLALDPARYGPDSSALAVRRGDVVEEIVIWNKLSTVETAGRVLVEMDRLGLPKGHGVTVGEPGLGGGVIDVLRGWAWRPADITAAPPHSRLRSSATDARKRSGACAAFSSAGKSPSRRMTSWQTNCALCGGASDWTAES